MSPYLLAGILSACGGGTEPAGGQAIIDLTAPATLFSGEPAPLVVRVRDRSGRGVPGVDITLTVTGGGQVSPTQATTGTDGTVAITWTTADLDQEQSVTARAGDQTAQVLRRTEPHLAELLLGPADTTLSDYGLEYVPTLSARTTTGRIVTPGVPAAFTITSEVPTLVAVAPLVPIEGGVRSNGPGEGVVRAHLAELASNSIHVTVTSTRPIIAPPTVAHAAPGATIVLDGAALDHLPPAAVTLNGVPAIIDGQTPSKLTLRMPSPAADCSGPARLALQAAGAWLPTAVDLLLDRPGDLRLAAGEVRELGLPGPTVCLQFAPSPDAEYVLVGTDTRSVESARASRQNEALMNTQISVTITDRTAPGAPLAGLRVEAAPAPSVPSDLRTGPLPTTAPPADYTAFRTVPWAPGDHFSHFENGQYLPGTVFRVTPRLALGVLDRDAALNIPQRLTGVDAALTFVQTFGVPLLLAASGGEWPATTEGAGQTLIIIRPIEGAGGLALVLRHELVNGVRQQNIVLLVGFIPGDQPSELDRGTLVHELAHAAQDRMALIRCRDLSDCNGDWFGFKWSTEGGAAFVQEEALRLAAGLSGSGNYPPFTLELANMFGFKFWWGLETPHWIWSAGYFSSTFLFRSLLDRAVAGGAGYEAALTAIIHGTMEGWFGYSFPPTRRSGLQARLAPWLGANWDPAEALHRAAAAIALDDRTPDPVYQVGLANPMTAFFPQAFGFTSGAGGQLTASIRGDTFEHYGISDRGLGGSYLVQTSVPGFRWTVARIR